MTFFITPFHYTDCFSVRQIGYGGNALPSESYIARLDYLAFNGKVCSSVAYSDEQRFLEDLKESLYHGEPLCVVLYRDRNGKTISRAFLNALDTLPKGLFIEDSSHRKPKERGEAR